MPRPRADAPLLNLELIRRTALRLIDEDGPEALSMRKLASELNVTPRSLYHYVPTKDALLREVYVSVLEEFTLPDPQVGTWQDNLRLLAREFRALCLRHKNVAPYFWGDSAPEAQDTAIIELLLRLLLQAGIPPEQAMPTCHALIVFLVGYILSELGEVPNSDKLEARRVYARQTPDAYRTLLSLPDSTTGPDEAFENVVALLIAGVEGRSAI